MGLGRFKPTTYFLFSLLLALGLHFLLPVVRVVRSPLRSGGIVLIVAGIWLNIWADNLFKQRNTAVEPFRESSALVLEGPYRVSRHPMYLGMTAVLIGLAILLGSLTAFLVPVLFLFVMEVGFIRHEERDMERTFGEEYIRYRRRVRRWF
jgi:protein-S-isoprenylcysteine O-methyltransferase Ste14